MEGGEDQHEIRRLSAPLRRTILPDNRRMKRPLLLRRLSGDYTVARLAAADAIPAWADGAGFVSISRSDDELSVLCRAERVPALVRQDSGWACMKLLGPFAFDETGIVLSVIRPLSEAGIGIFVVSTFDGDHLLIKQSDVPAGTELLRVAGHQLDQVADAVCPIPEGR